LTNKNEPIRHHYIPQFILRNFCFNDKNHLIYYDVQNKTVSVKETRDVFMSRLLYMDEVNHPVDRMRIERDFAEYEREVSGIINGSFLKDDEIIISKEEEDKLKVFFALMGFRSKNTYDTFETSISKDGKALYSSYQEDGKLTDLWKRNLGLLVNCRSPEDIDTHRRIDDPIKKFMQRDVFGYCGRHFSLVECREPHEFIIGDAFPTVIRGEGVIEMYAILPISPNRVLLSVCEGAEWTPLDVRVLRERVLRKPNSANDGRIRILNTIINEEEIANINQHIANSAKVGLAFRSKAVLTQFGIHSAFMDNEGINEEEVQKNA